MVYFSFMMNYNLLNAKEDHSMKPNKNMTKNAVEKCFFVFLYDSSRRL